MDAIYHPSGYRESWETARKPLLAIRVVGAFQLRIAERKMSALEPFEEQPRKTRLFLTPARAESRL